MSTAFLDFSGATPQDRETLLGRHFRNLHVFGMFAAAVPITLVQLDGGVVSLVGDPQKALEVHMALFGEPAGGVQ